MLNRIMVRFVATMAGLAPISMLTTIVDAQVNVVGQTEIDLLAGPGRTSAYLAPNGEYFAWFGPGSDGIDICIYTMTGDNTGCVPAAPDYDPGSVRWSPDSTKLAFAQDFLRIFRDSDIWMFDIETMRVTNLTDDGEDNVDLFNDDPDTESPPVDLAPLWGADSESLYFIRYDMAEARRNRPDLYRFDLNSGEEELVYSFVSLEPLSIYQAAASPDGRWLAYSVDIRRGRSISIRLLDLESGRDRLLTQMPEMDRRAYYIDYMQFSPDSAYLLIHDSAMLRLGQPIDPEQSPSRVFDLEGSETLIDPTQPVSGAAWLPEGTGLIYQVIGAERNIAYFVSTTLGEPGTLLLEGSYWSTTTYQERINLGANYALLMTAQGGSPVIVVQAAVD